jgi:hypothetical protein
MYPQDGDIVYAVEQHEKNKASIIKSLEKGNTWTRPYGTIPLSSASIIEVVVSPQDQDRLYVATSSGVWLYDGKKWHQRNDQHGLARDAWGGCYVSAVAVDPRNPKTIYAGRRSPGYGQSNGVFRSLDGGLSWANITGNLGPELTVWAIEVDPANSKVYIGTALGTWKFEPDNGKGNTQLPVTKIKKPSR